MFVSGEAWSITVAIPHIGQAFARPAIAGDSKPALHDAQVYLVVICATFLVGSTVFPLSMASTSGNESSILSVQAFVLTRYDMCALIPTSSVSIHTLLSMYVIFVGLNISFSSPSLQVYSGSVAC